MTSEKAVTYLDGDGEYSSGSSFSSVLEKIAETTQLDERHVGRTIGGGIKPPYNPSHLAGLQEANGTHAVAIKKKAKREVGYGFDVVPHPGLMEIEGEEFEPDDTQRDRVLEFWHGPSTTWRVGPRRNTPATPTLVKELARRDWHGIGWGAIELLITDDDQLGGLAWLPAETVRVRKAEREDGTITAGYGYVQQRANETVYFGEPLGRFTGGDEDTQTVVDEETGEVHRIHEGDDRPANPANELLFVPNPSSNTVYYGIPDWVAEIETMAGDLEARRFNREWFEFDSIPQYAVIVKGGQLSKDSRKELREMVLGIREAKERRVAILEVEKLLEKEFTTEDGSVADIDLEPLVTQGDEDMAFSEFRRMNEHDIAKVHEVPPVLIGVLEDANRSNSQEQIRDFTIDVVQPNQATWAEQVYRVVHAGYLEAPEWTLAYRVKGADGEIRAAERADLEVRTMRLSGTGTVDEARMAQGLDPVGPPVGDMMLAEFQAAAAGGQGGGGELEQMIERLVEDRVDDLGDELLSEARTQVRITRGAEAD